MTIYLDESGDLGVRSGSRFFVIAALVVKDRRELKLCVERIKRRKVKTPTPELKAYDATDRVREALLKAIAEQDIEIHTVITNTFIGTRKKPSEFYNKLAQIAIESCLKSHSVESLIVDRRNDKVSRDAFDKYIHLFHQRIKIEHLNSYHDKIIQATDFIAWSIRRKYDYDDKRYYNLIAGRIKSEIMWEEQ